MIEAVRELRYTLTRRQGLTRFPENGRLELDTNPVENQIRKIALTRKNALFAGHEVGAENRALLASLIANCKMRDGDPDPADTGGPLEKREHDTSVGDVIAHRALD